MSYLTRSRRARTFAPTSTKRASTSSRTSCRHSRSGSGGLRSGARGVMPDGRYGTPTATRQPMQAPGERLRLPVGSEGLVEARWQADRQAVPIESGGEILASRCSQRRQPWHAQSAHAYDGATGCCGRSSRGPAMARSPRHPAGATSPRRCAATGSGSTNACCRRSATIACLTCGAATSRTSQTS